jgi:hypothetical protein
MKEKMPMPSKEDSATFVTPLYLKGGFEGETLDFEMKPVEKLNYY